jgi:hypothetical protein
MKKTLLFTLALGGSLLLVPSTSHAEPDLRISWGIGGRHGGVSGSFGRGSLRHGGFGLRRSHHDYGRYRGSSRRTVPVRRVRQTHHHHFVAHYERVWVAPVYRSVFSGYNSCGHPIYRNVCVRNGYYRQVRRGSRCGCGQHR